MSAEAGPNCKKAIGAMAVLWTFRTYVSRRGTDEIRAAYDWAGKEVQGRFLARLRTLANLPLREWNENYCKKLSGECEGLWEIRFKGARVQHRPLGYHSADGEFTILLWAREKDHRFVPPNACEQALQRKSEVLADPERTHAISAWLVLE